MKAVPILKIVRNKSGALSISIRKYRDGRFGFDYKPPLGERRKVRRDSLESAEEAAKEMITDGFGDVRLSGATKELWSEFLVWRAGRIKRASVLSLKEKFISSKEGKGRTDKHLRDLKGVLDPFAADFDGMINDVTREQIEAWLDKRRVGPRRWNNMLSAIVALFRFAQREGVLTETSVVEGIDKKRLHIQVETYTPAELEHILKHISLPWIPAIVLGAFAGMRPEEIAPDPRSDKPRLQWSHFLWEKQKIDLPASISKTRHRRFVPLNEAALAYLKEWRWHKGLVAPKQKLSDEVRRIPKKDDDGNEVFTWKSDGLRHSFASYRLAVTKNLDELALDMGNSVPMIRKHYLDIKHDEEAKAWFAIRPPAGFKVPPQNDGP